MPFVNFIRVRDLSTGHEMDVPESVAADEAAFKILDKYPPNDTGYPRPAKHRVDLAAAPQAAQPAATKEK